MALSTETVAVDESPTMGSKDKLASSGRHRKIWIDLDNSPHVPFFLPIMEELRKQDCELFVTARNSYQVCELLDLHNLKCKVIGRHYGKHRLLKVLGTVLRTLQLLPIVVRKRPDLAVSHGSRAQLLLGSLLKIPTIIIYDYEFTQRMYTFPSLWFMTPEYVPDPIELETKDQMLKYPGLKEDVYVQQFHPDPSLRDQLGIPIDKVMITVRPPASEAHYHNPEAEVLLEASMKYFMERSDVQVVLLPRNDRQAAVLRKSWAEWISQRKIIIPEHAVDGLNLVWCSDLVVSGGGTMNREAAALEIPVYSIFRGKIGGVDRFLVDHGRLTLIENTEDIHTKIKIAPRDHSVQTRTDNRRALQVIVGNIVSVLKATNQSSNLDAS